MAIPGFEYFMLPILQNVKDGNEYYFRDVMEKIINETNLTEEERTKLLPSGSTLVVNSRVGWARTYLTKAGLIEKTKRGYFTISEVGLELLKKEPKNINLKLLEQYDCFKLWRTKSTTEEEKEISIVKDITPDELIENEIQIIKSQLEEDLLEQLKNISPGKFENIVVDLLVKMGYGGSKKEAAQVVGKSGDGGIDGIIKEDKLGLDAVYIQAKRWDSQVGRPEIQKFAGALLGQKAKKGVFITTGAFSNDALKYVENLDTKIVLIDGQYLTELMVEYDLGVNEFKIYKIKKIDSDYFIEE
ncbi:MAG: restriction endonuclease [Treponemataceae bacterium]|nr:MAG: restriction endonuclease [Treponemataceae bacterium]